MTVAINEAATNESGAGLRGRGSEHRQSAADKPQTVACMQGHGYILKNGREHRG
jgi:hypothetical protein